MKGDEHVLVEYLFMYLMIDVFCLAFSLFIFTKITIDMGTEREVHALRRLIVAFALFLAADAVWAMGNFDTSIMSPATSGIVETVTILLIGFVAYYWFVYVENRLHAPYANYRFFPLVAAIPILLVLLLFLTTPFTAWVFTIGPDASFNSGPLYSLMPLLFLTYVIYTTIHSLVCLSRERSSLLKREYVTLATFAIPPSGGCVIDVLMHGTPVMAITVFSSLLLVFMNSQNSRINTDTLTGLNNRRRAEDYIENSLDDLPTNAPFYLFMIDVDFFKEINDTWGHGEGDRALRIIAEGLRRAMEGHRGLASRWGGDEFLLATYLGADETPDDFGKAIQREIDAECERNSIGYCIIVSMGFVQAKPGKNLEDLVTKADYLLYEQKADHHRQAKP